MVAARPFIFLDYRLTVTMAAVALELVLCRAAECVEEESSTKSLSSVVNALSIFH